MLVAMHCNKLQWQIQKWSQKIFPFIFLFSVIISVFEGKVPDDGLLQELKSDVVTEETLSCLYAGLYCLLRSALRLPQTSLKPDRFKSDLTELK